MCDRHMGANEAQVLCKSKGYTHGSQLGADVSDSSLMRKSAVDTLVYGHLLQCTKEILCYCQTLEQNCLIVKVRGMFDRY